MTSSSVKRTAAIGVLKAAARAAEAPIGTRVRVFSGLSPNWRPMAEAIPAPIWTDGPSRPRAMPLASEIEEQMNLPMTVRSRITPECRKRAALV